MIKKLTRKALIFYFIIILIWIVSCYNGMLVEQRILVFIGLLIYIYLYKQLINLVKREYLTFNEGTSIYLWIDGMKLGMYHFNFYIYRILFKIKYEYKLKWLGNNLKNLFEYLWVFPYYVVMSKYYLILKMFQDKSFKDILLSRFYGLIILSPVLWWIWIFISKYYIYCYIFLVLIIYIYDNIKWFLKLKDVKILKYYPFKKVEILKYLHLLNLSLDPSFIFMDRNKVSVFALLIRNTISILYKKRSKADEFAFSINMIYLVLFDTTYKRGYMKIVTDNEERQEQLNAERRIVYSYKAYIAEWQIVVMRKALVNEEKFLFEFIFLYFFSGLAESFERLTEVMYARIRSEELNINIQQIERLEGYLKRLIKVLLFYLLDLSLLFLKIEEIKSIFKISTLKLGVPRLEYYIWLDFFKGNNYEKIKSIISDADAHNYKNYYEQIYLYCNIYHLYPNYGIDCGEYMYIYEYIDILFADLLILEIKNSEKLDLYPFSDRNYISIQEIFFNDYIYEFAPESESWSNNIQEQLNSYRNELFKEWQFSLYEMNKKTFYQVNNERLKELNNYVLKEVEKFKKDK